MNIFNYFKHIDLSTDQELALAKLDNFLNGSAQVFLLKGYAGTGKTTLIKGIMEYLKDKKKKVKLMAPTGRAAKILRDKTGEGTTIHKGIYNFERLETINDDSNDEAEKSLHYYFPIGGLAEETIIIVDESSMISSKESKNDLFSFGTDILLDDLLTFARLKVSNNKIIFVGDPAQLPPVGDNTSWALESSYFKGLELNYDEIELTTVKRQGDNLILENATRLRNAINQLTPGKLVFEYDKDSFVKLNPVEIVEKFTELFPTPEIGNGVIINFSNGQCYHLNKAIRQVIFPNQPDITAGDVVLINNNNYHTYGTELYNGDFAKVIETCSECIEQAAPVYVDFGGRKTRITIKLSFRKITIRVPSYPDDIHCYIIDSLLNSIDRDLGIDEMKALYINFVMRFNELQTKNKQKGMAVCKVGSEEFKLALKADPFYNALRVKYGYSITCHKAQGGEWKSVIVDYDGRVSLRKDPLRWSYTATTRGVQTVYAVNAPHFGLLNKFRFTAVGKIGTLPLKALEFSGVALSPFHQVSQHLCKSHKYWQVKENLESINCTIVSVQSFEYLERYNVGYNDTLIILEGHHKGSGHFADGFHVLNPQNNDTENQIAEAFNTFRNFKYNYFFYTEVESLVFLRNTIESICIELEITITNIVLENSFINFYFITDSICSYIQFYFNSQNQLTTAMPKTYNCDHDIKLNLLIQKLSDYVSKGN